MQDQQMRDGRHAMGRRTALGGAVAVAATAALSAAAQQGKSPAGGGDPLAYIGSYTAASKPPGHGEGVALVRMDPGTGALTRVKVFQSASPTWLASDSQRRVVYAVNEIDDFSGGKTGSVTAFGIDRLTGELTQINAVSSEGAGPAYCSVHPSGRFVFVANYGSGNVAVLPVQPNGDVGHAVDVQGDQGPAGAGRPAEGPPGNFSISDHNGPHAHMIAADPSGRFVIVNDLGLDRTFIWRIDLQTGKLTPNDPAFIPAASAGAGPRHFAFHPNGHIFYNLYEEASQLAVYDWNPQTAALGLKQKTTTVPGYAGTNFTSEIVVAPDGRFIYVANRLRNTIAVFAVASDGRVRWLGEEWTRGDYPRNIALAPNGRFIYACNHRSDNVTVFRVNPETGALAFANMYVPVGSPAIITFLS
ncbi:MAG: lactonase family protein [Pseudomonadota bacterium]|nr:lactonase family protein [Pseudomonadota bacterium]